MSEVKREVKTVQVDYLCDECGNGYMQSTGFSLMSNPPKYQHRCDNPECKAQIHINGKRYPCIEYTVVLN